MRKRISKSRAKLLTNLVKSYSGNKSQMLGLYRFSASKFPKICFDIC